MKSYLWFLGRIQGVVELTEESSGDKAAAFERISKIVQEMKASSSEAPPRRAPLSIQI